MELQDFKLPSRLISKSIEKRYIGDSKLKRQSPWLYDIHYSIDSRMNEINQLVSQCNYEGIDIDIERTETQTIITKENFKPEIIDINDENIESTIKHVICRLFALLHPEEQTNNLIGKKIGKDTNSAENFSYTEFVIEQIEESNQSCTPSQMIRSAKNAGAPHKGDELEDKLRQACEAIASRADYTREQCKDRSGYSYKKVEVAPEQLTWF